jgi:transposase
MSEALSGRQKVRVNVIKLHGRGLTNKSIARQLKIDVRTVRNTIKLFEETGAVIDRARLGRKKKITAGDRARLLKRVKGRERQSTRKTAASFTTTRSGKVSKNTIHREIRSSGLIPHRKKRRPKLTVAQKAKRAEFAKKYLRHDWANDVFWDEKEFELEHAPNLKDDIIWDEKGKEYFFEETKFPQAYKVGVALSSKGISRVVPYEGTIDSIKFQNMVVGPIDDMNELFDGERWRWVMDKATCHTSRSSQQFIGR